jgi:hypothetical protein
MSKAGLVHTPKILDGLAVGDLAGAFREIKGLADVFKDPKQLAAEFATVFQNMLDAAFKDPAQAKALQQLANDAVAARSAQLRPVTDRHLSWTLRPGRDCKTCDEGSEEDELFQHGHAPRQPNDPVEHLAQADSRRLTRPADGVTHHSCSGETKDAVRDSGRSGVRPDRRLRLRLNCEAP